MRRLEDLRKIFGGDLGIADDRTAILETRVSGLRTFIIERVTREGATLELAVCTPQTRELDPFAARREGPVWDLLIDGERVSVPLAHGFVFAGCRSGVLFARSVGQPTLEQLVTTLWELVTWARRPWHPILLELVEEPLSRRLRKLWDRAWPLLAVLLVWLIARLLRR